MASFRLSIASELHRRWEECVKLMQEILEEERMDDMEAVHTVAQLREWIGGEADIDEDVRKRFSCARITAILDDVQNIYEEFGNGDGGVNRIFAMAFLGELAKK
ncbi:MAG: hypothetical protein Q9226_003562 [Calogaya cf. arnoldii]